MIRISRIGRTGTRICVRRFELKNRPKLGGLCTGRSLSSRASNPCSRSARSAGYCAHQSPIHARYAGSVAISAAGAVSGQRITAGRCPRTNSPHPRPANNPAMNHPATAVRATVIIQLNPCNRARNFRESTRRASMRDQKLPSPARQHATYPPRKMAAPSHDQRSSFEFAVQVIQAKNGIRRRNRVTDARLSYNSWSCCSCCCS